MPDLRIGCSGWIYRDWSGPFYPDGLRQKDRLSYYASHFDTAEINASFYRLPTEAAVAGWRDGAPDGFLYAWKVSRFITHNKKLKDCQDSIGLVFGRMAPLDEKRGPALVQLHPVLKRDDERLARFLSWLPADQRVTVEFRHPSWYEAAVLRLLQDHDIALCISDHHDAPAPYEVTASWVYWRGHGPGGRYHGRYGLGALSEVAGHMQRWQDEGRDVFGYFDNDIKSAAPFDAVELKALLAR